MDSTRSTAFRNDMQARKFVPPNEKFVSPVRRLWIGTVNGSMKTTKGMKLHVELQLMGAKIMNLMDEEWNDGMKE